MSRSLSRHGACPAKILTYPTYPPACMWHIPVYVLAYVFIALFGFAKLNPAAERHMVHLDTDQPDEDDVDASSVDEGANVVLGITGNVDSAARGHGNAGASVIQG